MSNERYGIIANVSGIDRFLRLGSKAWLISTLNSDGWTRFKWLGRTRGGSLAQKKVTNKRFGNFRAAWIPDSILNIGDFDGTAIGTKDEMVSLANKLNTQYE